MTVRGPCAYGPRPARLYSRHQEGRFTSEDIIAALRYFRRKVGRPLTIVWDGLNQHHSAELRAQARASFVRLGHRHDVLAAFFHHAGLSLTGLP